MSVGKPAGDVVAEIRILASCVCGAVLTDGASAKLHDITSRLPDAG